MSNYAQCTNKSFVPFEIDVKSLATVCAVTAEQEAEYNSALVERKARRKATLKRYRDNHKEQIKAYRANNRERYNKSNREYRKRKKEQAQQCNVEQPINANNAEASSTTS